MRTAGAAQTLTSAAKALVLLALVAACFLLPATAPAPVAAAAVPVGGALLAAIVVALQGVIYTYDGWTGVIYFSGELGDPGRDVPRAMIGGVLAVTAIYLLLNLAFLHVVPVAALAGEPLAAAAAARTVLGPSADTVIRVILVIGLLSAVNALVLMGSRVAYAMSADGLFPRAGATVNPRRHADRRAGGQRGRGAGVHRHGLHRRHHRRPGFFLRRQLHPGVRLRLRAAPARA